MRPVNVLLFIMLAFHISVHAASDEVASLRGFDIRLNKDIAGEIVVENRNENKVTRCRVKDWDNRLAKGGGLINLTSDNIGLIINPVSGYVPVDQLLQCNNGEIEIRKIKYYDSDMAMLIDINFKQKIVLGLVVIDANLGQYQAIISKIDGVQNLIDSDGFWGGVTAPLRSEDDYFSKGESEYLGKISPDGRYVAPNDMDCSLDSFPGVWDMKEKEKVVFENNGSLSVDEQCKMLFQMKNVD